MESSPGDAWDDSFIMQIYHDSVKSHKTKGQSYKKRKLNIIQHSSSFVGEPGPWATLPNDIDQTSTVKNQSDVKEHTGDNSQTFNGAVGNSVDHGNNYSKIILENHLQLMLNSWFESGYATGRYYALREAYDGVPPPPGADRAPNCKQATS